MNIKKKITRRGLLASGTGLALAKVLSMNNPLEGNVQKPKGMSVYEAIGVKHVGVEAALVTTGAAGALLLGTAAAVTRADAKLIRRLPDTTGMKNEVILQKAHHTCYENQLTDVGTKLVEVETSP